MIELVICVTVHRICYLPRFAPCSQCRVLNYVRLPLKCKDIKEIASGRITVIHSGDSLIAYIPKSEYSKRTGELSLAL